MYSTGLVYDPNRDFSSATSNLVAIDGATGAIIWDTEIGAGIAGPGPVIANDVLFVGTLDGIIRGFSTVDGSEIWTVQTSAGVNAPFAAAGDMLFVPTGFVITPSADSPDPLPGYYPALIAFQLGATGAVTVADASAGAGDSTPLAEDGVTFAVNAFDLGFTPIELAIPADTDVTIVVTNDGVLQHDLLIEGTDFGTPLLSNAETHDLVVNLAAGTYAYFCSVAGHREAGMAGTLTVG
jgi:plastocyanin